MVNVWVGPSQVTDPLVKCGVTITEATTGKAVLLVAVKEGIFPFPVAAKPIPALLLVQE